MIIISRLMAARALLVNSWIFIISRPRMSHLSDSVFQTCLVFAFSDILIMDLASTCVYAHLQLNKQWWCWQISSKKAIVWIDLQRHRRVDICRRHLQFVFVFSFRWSLFIMLKSRWFRRSHQKGNHPLHEPRVICFIDAYMRHLASTS